MSDTENTEPADASPDAAADEDVGESSAVLSDAEVGALLEGVADGVVDTGGGLGRRGTITEYQFADNAHVSSYCPAALVALYERLSRRIRDDLRELVRGDVTIELDTLRRHRYDDYVASVNEPSSVTVLAEPTLPGAALMVFDAPLIATLVDRYYGGGASDASQAGPRPLTPVELRMARTCVNGILTHLNTIWSTVTPVAFAARESETIPKLVMVAGPPDPVLAAKFSITVGETVGQYHLVMPLSMIAPMRAALAASGQGRLATRQHFVTQMREHLHDVPVEMTATLCELELSLRDVVAMAPGDILPVDLPPCAVLRVDGSDVLHGRYGRSRGISSVAVQYRQPRPSSQENTR